MLHAFGVGFRGFLWNAQSEKDVDDEPVARLDALGEAMALLSQEDAAIGQAHRQPVPLQSRDRLDGGRVRDAQPTGDVGRARLAGRRQQVGDQLHIIFMQRA